MLTPKLGEASEAINISCQGACKSAASKGRREINVTNSEITPSSKKMGAL